MTQTVTIVVYPSAANADALTVTDAMRQVLDAFELLSCAEVKRSDSTPALVWKLEQASTNSPFRVVGSAISADPATIVDDVALATKFLFAEGLNKLLKSEERLTWLDGSAEEIVRRIFSRNMNGIGRTDIFIDDDKPPIILNHRLASQGSKYLDRLAAERASRVDDLTRTEYGSVEGRLTDLTTHYGRPAVILRTRLSNEDAKCVLDDIAVETIGIQYNWKDVWSQKRVLVFGAIYYGAKGSIIKIDTQHIENIEPKRVLLSDFQDYGLTSRIQPSEYLRALWGGSSD